MTSNNNKKKSFASVSGYKIAASKNLMKYVTFGKRAALAIFDEPGGLIPKGSKHMMEVFEKHKIEFEIASKKDSIGLNDADAEVSNSIFPVTSLTNDNITKNFYTGASNIPKFSIRLSLMNLDDVSDHFLPLLRQDIAECTGRCISRIPWGCPKHRPSCWPEDIAPWTLCKNPAMAQAHKFPLNFTEVMLVACYRFYKARGIDPEHYLEILDENKEEKKMRKRRCTSMDQAWTHFYDNVLPECDKPTRGQPASQPAPDLVQGEGEGDQAQACEVSAPDVHVVAAPDQTQTELDGAAPDVHVTSCEAPAPDQTQTEFVDTNIKGQLWATVER